VQKPVAQRLRLACGQRRRLAGAAQQSGPGGEVRGDVGDRQPGLVGF
jgi:hypothetical protein